MKFRIEQTVWEYDPNSLKFTAWVDSGEYVGSAYSREEIEEKCKLYKESKDVPPKITYLEI